MAQAENAFIRTRRERVRALRPIPEGAPAVGLALSGGGIRSATFCLGVLKGLAQAKVLPRIDLLSTVSGGGYIGSFLGGWFNRASGPAEVVEGLQGVGATESRPVRWLRENGYYLAPTGSADGTLMGAIMLRNWVALQVVLAMLVLAVFLALDARFFFAVPRLTWPDPTNRLWWSPWMYAPLAVFALGTLPQGWAYWMVTTPDPPKGRDSNPLLGLGLLLLASAAGGWVYGQAMGPVSLATTLAAVSAESVLVLIWLFSAGGLRGRTRVPSAEERLANAQGIRARLSRGLAASLALVVVLGVLGFVDSLGQSIFAVLAEKGVSGLKAWALGVGGGLVALALAAQQAAHRLPQRKEDVSLPLTLMAGLGAALLGGIALVVLNAFAHGVTWGFHRPVPVPDGPTVGQTLIRNAAAQNVEISLALKEVPKVYAEGNAAMTVEHPSLRLPSDKGMVLEWPDPKADPPEPRPDGVWYGWGLGISLGLSLLFGGIRSFLNASAMGSFYQRRITRAYLGATNAERETSAGGELWRRQSIRESMPGDDIPWSHYRPFDKGGPLHFVFTTVNETVDGKSQVEQRDRKGTGLGIGPAGLSVGVRHHATWQEDGQRMAGVPHPGGGWAVFPARVHAPEPLSLGQWVGISGAAFSTGMGFRTSAGLSLLCGMFNVRTGYWWWSGVDRWQDEGHRTPRAEGLFSRLFPVQAHLLDELRARFPGTAKRHWYLSDGGHFENSAIYEFARRRVPVILACDAGEDSGYLFDDLANLTLKLRSDFGAELTPVDGDDLRVAAEELQEVLGLTAPPRIHALDQLRRGEWETGGEGGPHLKKADVAGLSLGHAYAVRITYPGGGGSLVLFFKPALTGDETRDVAYYHAQHPAFPHEPTLDQFFDEAQWEAYRKLGEHAALSVLAPSEVNA
ncbi:MAG TPA: hypothetical protein VJ623_12390 [Holophagaceae bacterium]|nr:hypothetical protein [Holophagaceae bacterium]